MEPYKKPRKMQVDIYLREKRGDREIRFPLIPEEIVFQCGDAMGITYEIMGLGEVVIPSGTELDNYSWKCEFPGKLRQNDPMLRGNWADPRTYDSILRDWLKNGKELNLLVVGYPINADVYLKEYHSSAAGAFGDIYYEIGLMEARSIVITKTSTEEDSAGSDAQDAWNDLFKDMYITHVVVSGDTLWGLAERYYSDGWKWRDIYEENKITIENIARDHGREDSMNGMFIYPGTMLRIRRNPLQPKG